MTIYEKLNKARLLFAESGAKMSGKNTYADYSYFELADILPKINKLAVELGFFCETSFTAELASLTIRDTEQPESKVVFTSPMSSATLKGCHEVQNLGAVQTYLKRYLYQHAFEIVEADALNKTHDPKQPPAPQPTAQPPKQPTVSQTECAEISARLKLSDQEKRELWESSGQNYSNLVVMLRAKEKQVAGKVDAINQTLDAIWEASDDKA